MSNKKRVFSAEQKVRILREHLDNQVPVSELCERYGIQPNSFYTWKKKLFEGALQTFNSQPARKNNSAIEKLEKKLQDRDSLISTLVSENIQFKKNLNGER
ncbi:MAG: transposase [Caldithrix sp.]|jgi:transposase-like protein|nr:transposase [Caldithrix sp.]